MLNIYCIIFRMYVFIYYILFCLLYIIVWYKMMYYIQCLTTAHWFFVKRRKSNITCHSLHIILSMSHLKTLPPIFSPIYWHKIISANVIMSKREFWCGVNWKGYVLNCRVDDGCQNRSLSALGLLAWSTRQASLHIHFSLKCCFNSFL